MYKAKQINTHTAEPGYNDIGSFIHLFHILLILYRCGTSHVYI